MSDTAGPFRDAEREGLLSAIRDLERRCLEHGAGLPQQENAPDIWGGVLYRVGSTTFLSPLTEIEEVLDLPRDLTRVPATRTWVCGVANNRGTLLPIFDLQAFLFEDLTLRSPRNRVLVVRQYGFLTGFLISEVVGIRHFDASTHAHLIKGVAQGVDEFLAGGFSRGGNQYPVLSLQQLGTDVRFNLAA